MSTDLEPCEKSGIYIGIITYKPPVMSIAGK